MQLKRIRNVRGFTLVEILVGLLVLALLVGAALPRLSNSIKYFRFQNDLANVEKVLRYGQYHAILEGRVFKLELDDIEKSYALYRQVDPENFEDYEAVQIGSRRSYHFHTGTDFLGGRSEFYFFPDGTLSSPFRILLKSVHGARVEITNRGLGLFNATWQSE